jgi:predicted RNase H-like nuclease (RuvC/YqgF family)
MDNNYFPGQGLVNLLFSPEAPSPASFPDPNVVYAEPMNERNNREIRKLNDKVKLLEDEVRKLTHENENLKARIMVENKIENIYQLTPSFEKIEEMVKQLTDQLKK